MDELTLIIIRARVMTGKDCWDLAGRAQLQRKLWDAFQTSGIQGRQVAIRVPSDADGPSYFTYYV